MSIMKKALPLNVYRNEGRDCTNNGISSRFNQLLLLCEDGFVDVDIENPQENLVFLKERFLFGNYVYSIEPFAAPKAGHTSYMMGGNYAATSDSRFSEMMKNGFYGAVAIHDRTETYEEYDILSR